MKRTTKNLLTAAGVLVLIGAVLFVAALAMSHWDISALGTGKSETATFVIEDEFQNITIKADTADITFITTANEKCNVVSRAPSYLILNVSVQSGTLKIETADTRKWYEFMTFSLSSPSITVYLPEGEYASLLIDGSTGDVELQKGFGFGSADITLSTGDIRIDGVSADEMNLSVSTGRVDVSSAAVSGKLSLTVRTGKAFLKDISCISFVSRGSTGDVTLKNLIASGLIDIQRSTGDVTLDRCDAAELIIETDTGDVTGSLLSEKIFIANTDTGSVKVPETLSGGKCKITTDTGDIKITVQ